jgi:hypothetical protein
MTVKYPHLSIELVGQDGNAFSILGRLQGVLRRGGVPKDEIDAVMAEAQSGDYNHLLVTVMNTVEVDPYDEDEDEDEDDYDEDAYDEYDDDDVYEYEEVLG